MLSCMVRRQVKIATQTVLFVLFKFLAQKNEMSIIELFVWANSCGNSVCATARGKRKF